MTTPAIRAVGASADRLTPAERSAHMAKIRGRDTGPERLVRAALRAHGPSGWRSQHRVRGIRPDIVWPKARIALFIDGCYWHGCPRHATVPVGNRDFWLAKFASNRRRDRRQTRKLRAAGWTVVRVFTCKLRGDGVRKLAVRMGKLIEGP